ncbi:alpha-ketoglutarate-dependent dioxygenase AlkB [Salinicola salarius]|uniref:alpha-ketoglutarate-dependent dioxygenase AlkB family protein n=1 Tax=Salinicola salarius TaxID=430457 RepID=UPI0023E4323D|nr:alpha-ketoglutarate-dependent dioxygenase AlkB [Salinicola salarius]MDF3917376.1 alpha-ketoglutarate-dependent dioxygenase AlkB [Salinicola salarius]
MSEPDSNDWQRIEESPMLALLPNFLDEEEASRLCLALDHQIEWTSPTLQLYGRRHVIPRSQCWMGDRDAHYRYSGRAFQPQPWHPQVERLRDRVQQLLQAHEMPSAGFNSVLLNRYANGEQRMGWHSDDEPELGEDPIVASVSLGSERPLRFREKTATPRRAFNVWLPHGSLLLMGPGAQARWQHTLAPRAIDGVRINLTFRRIL